MTTRPLARRSAGIAAGLALALTLAACGGDAEGSDDRTGDSDVEETGAAGTDGTEDREDAEESAAGTVTIEDDFGTHEIDLAAIESIGAFDNRVFRVLEEFGVELSVAARSLMQPHIHGYAENEDILDTGFHREPNLEMIVAADPDLVLNGQRYSEYYDDIAALLSDDAVILQFDEGFDDPNTFFANLIEQTEVLGELFQAEEEAQALVDDLQDAMDRVEAAYDGASTVMGLLTSGGNINYAGPTQGRAVAPIFQQFDLVPALEVEDQSSDHEGDDISVEAIAQSNPDWIIVLDRDGMDPNDPEYTSAQELIAESPALRDVTAIQEDRVVYMPQNMYLTEDILAYTELLVSLAEALESAE